MDIENIKSTFFTIIILGLLGFGGYWAFSTMESGSSHIDNQKLKELQDENEDLKNEISKLNTEISNLSIKMEESPDNKDSSVVAVKDIPEEKIVAPTPVVLKYQSLIDDLQKIVDSNILMQKGSVGTRVGTVQKFLNIYNNTSNRIDNDYGPGTITAIKNFQEDQGLMVDGEAGSGTFRKMISWLKSN